MTSNPESYGTELGILRGIGKNAVSTQASFYRALPACHGKSRQRLRDDVGAFHRMCFQPTALDCSANRESVAALGEIVSPYFFVLPFRIVLYLQDRQTFIHRSLLRPFSLMLPSPALHKFVRY